MGSILCCIDFGIEFLIKINEHYDVYIVDVYYTKNILTMLEVIDCVTLYTNPAPFTLKHDYY